jgi:hypothetical protein
VQTEAVSALPLWAQIVFYVVSALGLAVFGLRQYVKSGKSAGSPPEGQIAAAAIFSTGEMRLLTEELYKTRQALREHCDCLNENTDAVKDASRLLRRMGDKQP